MANQLAAALRYRIWCSFKQRWILMLICIGIPVALSFLFLIIKSKSVVSRAPRDEGPVLTPPTKRTELLAPLAELTPICVCPDNERTRLIMKQVQETLVYSLTGLEFRRNAEEVAEYLANETKYNMEHGTYGYGIIFDELSATNLTYGIRSVTAQGWFSNLKYPTAQEPGPMENGQMYIHKGFLQLQIAINEAFSKLMLNISIPEWELQSFPYPAYKKEDKFTIMYLLLGSMLVYSMMFILSRFGIFIIHEKASGVKELLKINGVKTWMIYGSWFFMFGLITLFIAIINTVLWKYPLEAGSVLPNTNPIIVFIILIIFYWSALCSIGFIASLLTEAKYGMLFIVLYLIGSTIVSAQALVHLRTDSVLIFVALLPNGAIQGIFEAIAEYEAAGSGVTFYNLFFSPPVPTKILPVGINLILMICSMFIYLLLMMYIDAIKPGPHGRAKPWHFIFPKRFCPRVTAEKSSLLSGQHDAPNKILVENMGNNLPIGLEATNLVKVFGSLKAVNDLSLKIYKNQITALLGHNGAGKSTFFSIISGMYSPTSGSVYAENSNIFQDDNIEIFRRNLGFCPQHDLLMDELTVEQHLIFFGMLKGLTQAVAKERSDHWTTKFKIRESRDKLVSQLSGGMKRKLCLSLALVGNPLYLLLDEPTSGLDPESRRDIWDVLLTVRGDRTIIISTHFMEEADALGDSIAIVAHGRLKCYGSAMFLKKHFGSGYQLNITKSNGDVTDIVELIKKHVTPTTVVNKTQGTLSLMLPSSDVWKFPELFKALDSQFGNEIESSLSSTTMDDVFLKVQVDEGISMTIDDVDMPTMIRETNDLRSRQTTASLIWQQMEAFFIKRYTWAFCNWPSFAFFLVFLPALAMYVTIVGSNTSQEIADVAKLSLSLDTYGPTSALIAKSKEGDKLAPIIESAITSSGSTFQEITDAENITGTLLDSAKADLVNYRSKMVVSFDTRGIPNGLYSTLAYHSMPIAYGMMINAIIQQNNSSATIKTYNFPYQFSDKSCDGSNAGGAIPMIILWIIIYGSAMLYSTSYFIIFPHTERVNFIKHLQLMTGAQPFVYWITNLIADFTLFMIPVIISLLVIVATDDYNLYTSCIIMSVLSLVLILFGLSSITYAYFCSYFFKRYTSAMELFIFLTWILAIISAVAGQFEQTKWTKYIFNLFPYLPLVGCFYKIVQFSVQAAMCSACNVGPMAEACKDLMENADIGSFDMNTELIYLAVDPFVFIALILLIDHGFFRMIMSYINSFIYGPIDRLGELSDLDVSSEKENVAVSKTANGDTPPIFVCDDIGKKFSRKLTAVFDVTFAIKKGECFGLLGVNGAGKSTTFGMLTGSLIPSKGDARIMKYSLREKRYKYLKRLGYCPQFDGFLPEMSARSQLSLFGRLRGMPSSELGGIVQKWIDALDMADICDLPCQGYSGGNKRKLSTAMALIADPSVVLLDEPTTGVDPVVRRKIWSILKYCREMNGQTVIITSHSMDECESLCGRLTIMVKGVMKCIGTIPRLKNVYGHGYILLVKLRSSCTQRESEEIESLVKQQFGSNIKLEEKQHGLFTFHINSENVKLYKMFEIMVDLKANNSLIDDFSLSDISLEHVFISFAKDAV